MQQIRERSYSTESRLQRFDLRAPVQQDTATYAPLPPLSLQAPAAFVEKKRAALYKLSAYGRICVLFQPRSKELES